MAVYEGPIQDLIDELGRLPGVGPKSAQRIAFYLLPADPAGGKRLSPRARTAEGVGAGGRVPRGRGGGRGRGGFSTPCSNVAEAGQCRICRDARRSDEVLCV